MLNQAPPFQDVDLFTSDIALMENVARYAGTHSAKRLTAFGLLCGAAEAFQRGRLANEHNQVINGSCQRRCPMLFWFSRKHRADFPVLWFHAFYPMERSTLCASSV